MGLTPPHGTEDKGISAPSSLPATPDGNEDKIISVPRAGQLTTRLTNSLTNAPPRRIIHPDWRAGADVAPQRAPLFPALHRPHPAGLVRPAAPPTRGIE